MPRLKVQLPWDWAFGNFDDRSLGDEWHKVFL